MTLLADLAAAAACCICSERPVMAAAAVFTAFCEPLALVSRVLRLLPTLSKALANFSNLDSPPPVSTPSFSNVGIF